MKPLSLQPHRSGPFVVLEAVGELDLQTQDEFEQVLGRHLVSSPVVVDLSGVEFLAISALRALIVCHRLAGSVGHELHYARPTPQTRRLLSVSGLGAVLPVTTGLPQAVAGSAPLSRPPRGLTDQPGRDLAELDVG